MPKVKIRINEVRAHKEWLRNLNRIGIDNIEFVDDNYKSVLEIMQSDIDNFKETGLNVADFVDCEYWVPSPSDECVERPD